MLSIIGFSSFKGQKAWDLSYCWFEVYGVVPVGENPMYFSSLVYVGFTTQSFLPSTVTDQCNNSSNLCVIGYTRNQISGFIAGAPAGLKARPGHPGEFTLYRTHGGVAKGE